VITEIEEIEAAQKKVSAAITANEGDGVWPFNVWEAWQELDGAVVKLRAAYEDAALDAKFEAER
jgi:hypothetical protein